MGLSVTLSNALSGMRTTQDGLTVLSRNVANAGASGYHRQSVVIKDMNGGSSTYSSFVGVERAFVSSLERAYVREVGDMGYADVRNTFLERLEVAFGKPGDANSLDTLLQDFTNSMQALAVSPEDYATRATTISSAQTLAQALNGLSGTVQELRQETETQIAAEVDTLNQSLQSLRDINVRLSDYSLDEASRLSVLDERDRLVARVSEIVDTQAVYRTDGTVALMTKSGLGLLDQGATTFTFAPAGALSANSLYAIDDAENGVGVLTAYTPSGLRLDVLDQKIVQSGRLAALVELRDTTLVQTQAQLDSIAAALAQALNTNETAGTAVTGPPDGFDIGMADIAKGNEVSFSYVQSGQSRDVRIVRVDDPSKLPMDYRTPGGERVIGVDFSGAAGSVAAQLNAVLGPGISFADDGTTLSIRDDGGVNSTITSASKSTSSTATQGAGLALNLFTDLGDQAYTGALDGEPQARGFAARITVNSVIANDNSLLVQYDSGGTLGDPARVDYMLDRMETVNFRPDNQQLKELGGYSLSGDLQSLVQQVINYQGDMIANAKSALDTQQIALDAVELRMDAEYGVSIDEEMARLMELQNAYAASARVVSIAQELIDALMNI
ncbi:MAG: flagellar hook-associated protein FlgK [Alphaproteobacteria bacterium]|nr:flagellar hook-associated protein FlgK [Alphaproteobacteria bacterium]